MRYTTTVSTLGSLLISASVSAATLTIGDDISQSSPLESQVFANATARIAHDQVMASQVGDWVRIRPIGSRSLDTLGGKDVRITRQNKPEVVAAAVKKYIEALPSKGNFTDKQSNIIAFFKFSSEFDCAHGGRVLVISDGLESSPYISQRSLLAGKPLPPPATPILTGCSVTMFIGHSKDTVSPKATDTLVAAWSKWMKAAGVRNFTPIVDF